MENQVAHLAIFLGEAYRRRNMIYDTDNIGLAMRAIWPEDEDVTGVNTMALVSEALRTGVISLQEYRGRCWIIPGNVPPRGEKIDIPFGGIWGAKVGDSTPVPTAKKIVISSSYKSKDARIEMPFKIINGHRVWSA